MSFLARVCLAMILILPLPALAQSTSTEDAAPIAVANGQQIGAWSVSCVAVAVGETNCTLTQRILRANDNAFVADMIATRNEQGNTFVIARVPVGAFLPTGFAMRDSENEDLEDVLEFTWQACNREICEALLQLENEQVSALSAETNTMIAAFRPSAQSEPFLFQLSMNGMASGLDAIGR